jgi:hypothetical protein
MKWAQSLVGFEPTFAFSPRIHCGLIIPEATGKSNHAKIQRES